MKTLRASFLFPLFGLIMSVAACSGQAPEGGSENGVSSTDNAVTQPAQAKEQLARKVRGPASLLSLALRDPSIGLDATQRTTIEAAMKALAPKGEKKAHDPAKKAALAAAVRAGNVEAITDKPAVEISSEKKTAVANALTVLHSTLTGEQRVALVAAADKTHEAKKEGGKAHKHHKADKGQAKGVKTDKTMKQHEHGSSVLASLDLTPEQQAQIKAKKEAAKPAAKTEADREAMKAKRAAAKKERSARLATFTTDSFDAQTFLARPEGAPAKVGRGDRMTRKLAFIVPILTPEQREKLAIAIEKGPADKAPAKPTAL